MDPNQTYPYVVDSPVAVYPAFAAKPKPIYSYRATVVQVHDGDTITVDIDLGLCVTVREKIRLLKDATIGVNTPELNTDAGKLARGYVVSWFAEHGQQFTLQTVKDKAEKFGRYLGIVVAADGANLGEDLITSKHGLPWDGSGPRPT